MYINVKYFSVSLKLRILTTKLSWVNLLIHQWMKCGLLFLVKIILIVTTLVLVIFSMTLSKLMHSLPAFQMIPHIKLKMFELIVLLQWSVTFQRLYAYEIETLLSRMVKRTAPGRDNIPHWVFSTCSFAHR